MDTATPHSSETSQVSTMELCIDVKNVGEIIKNVKKRKKTFKK